MYKLLLITLVLSSTLFGNKLTLNNAEMEAVKNSFTTRKKYLEEKAREWEKKSVITGYLPKIDYTLTYLRMASTTVESTNVGFLSAFSSDPVGPIPEEAYPVSPNTMFQNTFTHEFSVNQPISNGGVEIVAIKIAKHTKKAIKHQVQEEIQSAIYNAREAYFNAISAKSRRIVSEEDLIWTQKNLEVTKQVHEAGKAPITDLLQWQTDVSIKESNLLEAKATEKFMLLNLLHAIGMSIDKYQTIELESPDNFYQMFSLDNNILTGDISSSPTLKALNEFTIVQKQNKNIALTNFLPKINAFGQVTTDRKIDKTDYNFLMNGKINSGNFYKTPWTWSAGAIMTVPLFTSFKNSTTLKKAKYDLEESILNQKEVESQLTINLERIKLFYEATHAGVISAQKQMDLMKKNLDIMQSRYDGGLVNQSQLREVALGYKQTRIGYIQKLFECLLLESEFKKNRGTLEVSNEK